MIGSQFQMHELNSKVLTKRLNTALLNVSQRKKYSLRETIKALVRNVKLLTIHSNLKFVCENTEYLKSSMSLSGNHKCSKYINCRKQVHKKIWNIKKVQQFHISSIVILLLCNGDVANIICGLHENNARSFGNLHQSYFSRQCYFFRYSKEKKSKKKNIIFLQETGSCYNINCR